MNSNLRKLCNAKKFTVGEEVCILATKKINVGYEIFKYHKNC